MKLLGNSEERRISILKDPFKKTRITNIMIYGSFSSFGGVWNWHGNVEFRNGNTRGKQTMDNVEGIENFHIMVSQIEKFIETLED